MKRISLCIIPAAVLCWSTAGLGQVGADDPRTPIDAPLDCESTDPNWAWDQETIDRGLARVEQHCGGDEACWASYQSFLDSLWTLQELRLMGQGSCQLVSELEQQAQALAITDWNGQPLELPTCMASSAAWCGEDIESCPVDLIGDQPFSWPQEPPVYNCEALNEAIDPVGQALWNMTLPHNPTIYGDPAVPAGEIFHDTESPYGQHLVTLGETEIIQADLIAFTEGAGLLLDTVALTLDDLVRAPNPNPSPEDVVDELGLDPSIIQPWTPSPAMTLPTHPRDADCELIRLDLAAKQAALAGIDCSDLEAALLAALLDLADAQADFDAADTALALTEALYDAAFADWQDAATEAQAAADAIEDLVNRHIHHSGISTDGAGGAHGNMIGLSTGGIGFSIYFDGSSSSVNTLLWFFGTDAYKSARQRLVDAGKALKAAETALNDATADYLDAMLDWLDAADALAAAQARADALQAALDACLARQRAAQQDVDNCQDELDECVGRQQTDTDAAQGSAGGSISGAEQELDEADDRGADTSGARSRLQDAEDKLDESEQAESEGRHDDAQELAGEAEEIADGVKQDWEEENEFWATHSPCPEEGLTREEVTSEVCTWGESEPHVVPLGHTPTSYRALGVVRKLVAVTGYALTGSDPVNEAVDNIMGLTTLRHIRDLFVFYYGNRGQTITTYECVSDGDGHIYWVETGSRNETSELPECMLHLTSDLEDVLDISLLASEAEVESAVRDMMNRCRPTGCECELPPACH